MEKIKVELIEPAQAAEVMQRAGLVDPAGRATAQSIAAGGQCFSLQAGGHEGVFVLKQAGGQLWVSGAGAVGTAGLAGVGMQVVSEIARHAGCTKLGFQTGRPGLVKLARKQGFKVVGFILQKDIK